MAAAIHPVLAAFQLQLQLRHRLHLRLLLRLRLRSSGASKLCARNAIICPTPELNSTVNNDALQWVWVGYIDDIAQWISEGRTYRIKGTLSDCSQWELLLRMKLISLEIAHLYFPSNLRIRFLFSASDAATHCTLRCPPCSAQQTHLFICQLVSQLDVQKQTERVSERRRQRETVWLAAFASR